jgi:alpha-ribazole phosphatase
LTLWLVRHPAPVGGAGRCYGRTDLPTDAAETARAAERLATVLPPGARAFTSPLRRCQALADALQRRRPDLDIRPDARLVEMDFGHWEGRPWAALDAATLDAWTRDFWQHRPGGGESVQAVFARVEQALDDSRAGPGDVVWLTHAGVIRTVQLLARGVRRIDRAQDWPRTPVPFGSWVALSA